MGFCNADHTMSQVYIYIYVYIYFFFFLLLYSNFETLKTVGSEGATVCKALCWDYYDLCVNAFKNQKENAKQ